jgi:hypothetical protein
MLLMFKYFLDFKTLQKIQKNVPTAIINDLIFDILILHTILFYNTHQINLKV